MSCVRIPSRSLFSAGLVAMILSSLLQLAARRYPAVHPDLVDGLRGLCLGVYFGAMALTLGRKGRRAA